LRVVGITHGFEVSRFKNRFKVKEKKIIRYSFWKSFLSFI